MTTKARDLMAKAGLPLSDAKDAALLFCAAIGAWKIAKVGKNLAYGTWKHMLRPRRKLLARYSSADGGTPWAVVTGGAEGIGKAYCEELAKMGFNLCVIDKNADLLKSLKFSTSLITIHFDLANLGTEEGLAALEKEMNEKLAGKDVAVLVNNAAEFQHKDLVLASWTYILRASNVNAHSYAAMARYFVPKLLARATGGVRSAVINVGTCAAEPQNPRYRFSIYGATKAYTHILSSSLQEMYSDKLDVMTVIPRQTETSMNPAGYMFTVQPEQHAKAVMDQLGHEAVTYGPLVHCLEYNMRYQYTLFGGFDKWVQWRNKARNENLVKVYDSKAK